MFRNLRVFAHRVTQFWQNRVYKFGVKLGLAGGAGYYLTQEGVWRESSETSKIYGKIIEGVTPYWKEVAAQVPIEIPDLPNSERLSFLTTQCWNAGVSNTFQFLVELPSHVCEWSDKGAKALSANPEIQKFVDSLKAAPTPVKPVE